MNTVQGIEAWYQINSKCEPHEVVIVGFTAAGAFGASAVAVYYSLSDPLQELSLCPVNHLRMKPLPKPEGER